MRAPYEGNEEALNEALYDLVKSADLDINYQVFRTMVDLLREGVTPEALYFLLTQVITHSGYYQKMRKFTSKTLGDTTSRRDAANSRIRSMGDLTVDRSPVGQRSNHMNSGTHKTHQEYL